MGIFKKAATKLHIKGGKTGTTGHLKHDYESKPVTEEEANAPPPDQNGQAADGKAPTGAQADVQNAQKPAVEDKTKRGPAKLVMEHAPKAPPWARKGLDENTTYTLHKTDADEDPSSAIQQDLPGGKAPMSTRAGQQEPSQSQQQAKNQRAAEVIPSGATQQSPAQQPSGKIIQVGTIFKGLVLVWLLLTLVYIQLFNLSILGMILPALIVGLPIGLGLSWLFYYQLGSKKKISTDVSLLCWTTNDATQKHACHEHRITKALPQMAHHKGEQMQFTMHSRFLLDTLLCNSAQRLMLVDLVILFWNVDYCGAAEHHAWAERPCTACW